MLVTTVLQEYAEQHGIQDAQFTSKGSFSMPIEGVGILSLEQEGDGLLVALFQNIEEADTADFMEKALKASNPIEHERLITVRPLLYNGMAGMIAPIEEHLLSVSFLNTTVDILYKLLLHSKSI